MQFATAVPLALVPLSLFVVAHAANSHIPLSVDASHAKDLAACIQRFTAGCDAPESYYREVAEVACDWSKRLLNEKRIYVPLDGCAMHYGKIATNPYVQAAISYGALQAVLQSASEPQLQERLVLLERIAPPSSLVFAEGGAEFMPIQLFASGLYIVPLSVVQVVSDMTAKLTDKEKAYFPDVTYALASQYVFDGGNDQWEVFQLWTLQNSNTAVSADLIVKLLAAQSSMLLHVPPQPANHTWYLEGNEDALSRLRNVMRVILKVALPKVINETVSMTINKPLLNEALAQVEAQKGNVLLAKQAKK